MPATTTLEDRIQIMESSEAGESAWRIAQRLRWRPSTIRKWRNRGRKLGRQGLVTRMGRPKVGALGSYSKEMHDTLLRWHQEHPGWGPGTLKAELAQPEAFSNEKCPSRASIGRFLREQGLTKTYEPHHELPKTELNGQEAPHDVWEMDACGYQDIPDVGQVALINLNDRFSHVRLLSYPCCLGQQRVERHANSSDYQTVLRLAFTRWGLPKQLQVDHESVFFDNKTKSPFPTLLHLWLLALGVELRFARVRRPTDQGMTERSHQLWNAQVVQGQTFANWQALYKALQDRRDFLNQTLPCDSLDHQPPLVAYPKAHHSGRFYRPEWEARLLDLNRVYDYLAQGRWFRRVSAHGTISLGGAIYYVGAIWKTQQIEITLDPSDHSLMCRDAAGDLLKRLPVKNVSPETLIGAHPAFLDLPAFQLCLPFLPEEQNVIRLFELTAATT